jgi:antitoxin (DNA-binding transcriptional repressor) of toxin-antitoxin stability system
LKKITPFLACCALAVALPASAEDLSDLRPGSGSNIAAPPVQLDRALQVTETAVVVDVDRKQHLITVQTEDSTTTTVVAKSLKNLHAIKKGDLVDITYMKSTVAHLVPVQDAGKLDVKVSSAEIVSEDSKHPGKAEAEEVRVTIKLISVDPYKKTITYRNPNSQIKEISMNTPRLLPYLKTLKDGDVVEVVYTRAMAVSVVPKKR